MPADITIFRGDTPTISMPVVDKAANNAAFNLTGYTGQFYMKRQGGTETVDKAVDITDAAAGKCEVTLIAAETAPVGTWDAELEIRKAAAPAKIYTVRQFTLEILQDRRTAV